VAVLAAAQKGLSIHEYPPKRVKQAIVGKGAAAKDQVAFMIRALLGLTETPPSDAADAIAIGLTHLRTIASPIHKVTAKRAQ
jgi:crossover junction endodeoxyribonuclease RuvC